MTSKVTEEEIDAMLAREDVPADAKALIRRLADLTGELESELIERDE